MADEFNDGAEYTMPEEPTQYTGIERRKNNDVQLAIMCEQLKNITAEVSEIKGIVTNLALHDQRITACEHALKDKPPHDGVMNEHIGRLSSIESRLDNCEESINGLFNRSWAVILMVISAVIAWIIKWREQS